MTARMALAVVIIPMSVTTIIFAAVVVSAMVIITVAVTIIITLITAWERSFWGNLTRNFTCCFLGHVI